MPEIFGPTRLANAKNLRDRDDVMWEIDKAVEAWEADIRLASEREDVNRSFIEQYQVEVAALRRRMEAMDLAFGVERNQLVNANVALRQRLETALNDAEMLGPAQDEIADLRKRLEAAEKALWTVREFLRDGYMGSKRDAMTFLDAALAAGEKKP